MRPSLKHNKQGVNIKNKKEHIYYCYDIYTTVKK